MVGEQNFSRGIAQLNGSVGVDVQLSFLRSSAVTGLAACCISVPLVVYLMYVVCWAVSQPWD
jgi:hypothetical protein